MTNDEHRNFWRAPFTPSVRFVVEYALARHRWVVELRGGRSVPDPPSNAPATIKKDPSR